ncbi:MAG TPA: hypothetical protein VFJ19_03190 [Nocardioidaceae bacterium]|nr:hypothetical protein [Nocardioidaceae bacterium]
MRPWIDGTVSLLLLVVECVILSWLFRGPLWEWMSRQARRLPVPRQESEPRPVGEPIETIASDLRRLRYAVEHAPPGQSMPRTVGSVAAYDRMLSDACRALGIPDTLAQLPPGTDRDAERLRVEYLLEDAGVVLRVPGAA